MVYYNSNLNTVGSSPITDKTIVLDLDECLLHTFGKPFIKEMKIFTDPKLIRLRRRVYRLNCVDFEVSKGTGHTLEVEGIRRPHLDDFLAFCFSYFKVVAVWSAGRREYVHAAVDVLFKNIKRPHVIYTYDDIRHNSNGGYDKPLQKMIDQVPNLSKYMSLSNVFMLDDRAASFAGNALNGIQIPVYKPELTVSSLLADDIALLQVMKWLSQPDIIAAKDTQFIDKSTIFTTPLNKTLSINIVDENQDLNI